MLQMTMTDIKSIRLAIGKDVDGGCEGSVFCNNMSDGVMLVEDK
jgi:hypothetical protein